MASIPSRERFARFLGDLADLCASITKTEAGMDRAMWRARVGIMLDELRRYKAWPIEVVGHEPPNGWIGKDRRLLGSIAAVLDAANKSVNGDHDQDHLVEKVLEARELVLGAGMWPRSRL